MINSIWIHRKVLLVVDAYRNEIKNHSTYSLDKLLIHDIKN